MALFEADKVMIRLMILYGCAVVFGFLASVPMIYHVSPISECLLFSTVGRGGNLFYGHYAICNFVAYVFLFVILGAIYLFFKCMLERGRRKGHAKAGKFEDQHVPKVILTLHVAVTCMAFLLTIIVTSGYISACNNLDEIVSRNVKDKLTPDPYGTRGEELKTVYEDDYKFHRYTNRYGNAWGAQFYTISVTCRSIFTDPEIYTKLHNTHYEQQSRYYGYWYGLDLNALDPQAKATETNALIEASLAGSWLCFGTLLAGLILMIIQRVVLKKESDAAERMSVHSTMMGTASLHRDQSMMNYSRNGSVLSGSMRGSNFQRGGPGSIRGSDRSMKSSRRDIDDIALSMHHMGGSQHIPQMGASSGGYGRKELDDMILNQHIAQNSNGARPINGQYPSAYSSRETGYNSGNEALVHGLARPPRYHTDPHSESTILQREEVETEIF